MRALSCRGVVPDAGAARPRVAGGPPMSATTPPAPAPKDPVLENLVWLQRTREKRLAEARKDRGR